VSLGTRLGGAFLDRHPDDAAEVMEEMSAGELATLIPELDLDSAAPALCLLTPELLGGALDGLPPDVSGKVLGALPYNNKLAILSAVDREARARLLRSLPARESALLEHLSSYPARSAATLLEPAVFSVPADVTVKAALQRSRASRRPLRYYVYVLDADKRLVGVVSVRQLVQASPDVRLADIMRRDLATLSATDTLADIVSSPHWRSHHMLPVVDTEGVMLGVIRYETLQKLREEHDSEAGASSALQTLMALGEVYWLGLGVVLGAGEKETDPEQNRGA
jgi:magnesium transporter